MYRKVIKTIAALGLMFVLFGCGAEDINQNQGVMENNNSTNTEESQIEKDTVDAEENVMDADEEVEATEQEISVFFANEDATGFAEEIVQIESLSKEQILGVLVKKGVLIQEVKAQSIEQLEKEGVQVLNLDFSTEFETYINSLGTTGEYLTLGSICNTFLDAYECEKIKITVNGEDLVTGHATYSGYMEKFY